MNKILTVRFDVTNLTDQQIASLATNAGVQGEGYDDAEVDADNYPAVRVVGHEVTEQVIELDPDALYEVTDAQQRYTIDAPYFYNPGDVVRLDESRPYLDSDGEAWVTLAQDDDAPTYFIVPSALRRIEG